MGSSPPSRCAIDAVGRPILRSAPGPNAPFHANNIGRRGSVLPAVKRLLVLLIALVIAGCGQSTEEEWGGYTEGEAKQIMKDARGEIIATAPPTNAGPAERIYPTNEEIDDYDLRKAHVQGEEAWEYKRDLGEETGDWCIYISEDPGGGTFLAQVGPCYLG